jgi:hypothetical protein
MYIILMYNVYPWTMVVECTYLTISAQDVLILSTKAVDHVHNMGNACMMEPEPAFLSPCV